MVRRSYHAPYIFLESPTPVMPATPGPIRVCRVLHDWFRDHVLYHAALLALQRPAELIGSVTGERTRSGLASRLAHIYMSHD